MNELISNRDDNLAFLQQGVDLLQAISPEQFSHSNPPLYTGGIGPHLRHCLDHYRSLLDGLGTARIDYDVRDRNPRLETDPAFAIQEIKAISKGLCELNEGHALLPLQVKMDCGSTENEPWAASSVKRELQFLISHTVHHYALIAMICRDQGIEPIAGFGIAPSTIKYQQAQAACVPSAG
jgi:hypothetical protein